jgi:hypothetical protein
MFLAIHPSDTYTDLAQLERSTQAVKRWFFDNDLVLNADKSEVSMMGSAPQFVTQAIYILLLSLMPGCLC